MLPIRNILVPIDFSEHADRALETAVSLAKAFEARVHLLHCYQIHVGGLSPYGLVIPETLERDVRDAAARRLGELRDGVTSQGVAAESTVTPRFPSDAITDHAREINADLIVMGTRGLTGLKHVLLGSVAERILRTAPCPVLTVKAGDD
jgi:nucleotide-binding universal stress UspA family protein